MIQKEHVIELLCLEVIEKQKYTFNFKMLLLVYNIMVVIYMFAQDAAFIGCPVVAYVFLFHIPRFRRMMPLFVLLYLFCLPHFYIL